MWWKTLIFLAMSAVVVLVYTTAPPQAAIGPASRVFYFHVPMAWISVLAFAVSMVYSIRYLKARDLRWDDRALAGAQLGLLFCMLAAISGSIFARVTWGAFWNWDPRETSIFVLLLIYAAYLALRGAVEQPDRRAALAAVYSIFAFVTVPFLIFVVPRVVPSLHPTDSVVDETLRITMSSSVTWLLLLSLATFTGLFLWLFSLTVRIKSLARNSVELED